MRRAARRGRRALRSARGPRRGTSARSRGPRRRPRGTALAARGRRSTGKHRRHQRGGLRPGGSLDRADRVAGVPGRDQDLVVARACVGRRRPSSRRAVSRDRGCTRSRRSIDLGPAALRPRRGESRQRGSGRPGARADSSSLAAAVAPRAIPRTTGVGSGRRAFPRGHMSTRSAAKFMRRYVGLARVVHGPGARERGGARRRRRSMRVRSRRSWRPAVRARTGPSARTRRSRPAVPRPGGQAARSARSTLPATSAAARRSTPSSRATHASS